MAEVREKVAMMIDMIKLRPQSKDIKNTPFYIKADNVLTSVFGPICTLCMLEIFTLGYTYTSMETKDWGRKLRNDRDRCVCVRVYRVGQK